jgi:hypothetical protein
MHSEATRIQFFSNSEYLPKSFFNFLSSRIEPFGRDVIKPARSASIITPMLQKPEGFRTKATRVKLYLGTAIPWQRRIWSHPAFPKGKKDREIRLILE